MVTCAGEISSRLLRASAVGLAVGGAGTAARPNAARERVAWPSPKMILKPNLASGHFVWACAMRVGSKDVIFKLNTGTRGLIATLSKSMSKELIRLAPDVILANSTPVMVALQVGDKSYSDRFRRCERSARSGVYFKSYAPRQQRHRFLIHRA